MRAASLLSLTLIAGSVVLASACSDQDTAAPTQPTTVLTPAASIASTSEQSAAGKKQTPAFTTITRVITPYQEVNGYTTNALAECPAGTFLTGGGYAFKTTGSGAVKPRVRASYGDNNRWIVMVETDEWVGLAEVPSFAAVAYCIS
jgi:hypothetical protein